MADPIILVAEDEILIRTLISEHLADSGFQVLEASNAEVAREVIKSRHVDLVFTDVNMPGALQGDSLADWLSTYRPSVPVIVTSGVAKPALRGRGRRFIRKPYSLIDLEHQIRELLH